MNQIEAHYYRLLEQTGYVYTVLLLVPVIVAWIYWKRLSKPLKVFHWYLVARIVIVLTSEVLYRAFVEYSHFWTPVLGFLGISNMHFMNILSSLSQVIGIGYFYMLLSSHAGFCRVMKYVMGGMIVLISSDYFFFEGYKRFGQWAWLEGIFILVVPALFLWKIIKKDTEVVPLKNSYFLISLGLFLTNLIALVYFFLGSSLYETNMVLFVKMQLAKNGVNVLGQLLFLLAFRRAYLLRFWNSPTV